VFRVSLRSALLAFLVAVGTVAGAAPPSTNTQAEIAHLLSYLETSRCEFYRNGAWYDSREARAHLEKKKSYLMNRSLIGSTEDFIDRAATASSVSGEKYQVRCRPSPAVPSGAWLRAELERFRAARGVTPRCEPRNAACSSGSGP
jgi:hypothetical protein